MDFRNSRNLVYIRRSCVVLGTVDAEGLLFKFKFIETLFWM